LRGAILDDSCGAGYRVRTGDIKLGTHVDKGQDLEMQEAVTATKAAKTGFRESIRPENRPDSSKKLTEPIFPHQRRWIRADRLGGELGASER